jgi:hypothetical protein
MTGPTQLASEKQFNCADCGGWDVEWMYKCHTHGVEYCRGCSCPYCAEDGLDDDYECWEPDDE